MDGEGTRREMMPGKERYCWKFAEAQICFLESFAAKNRTASGFEIMQSAHSSRLYKVSRQTHSRCCKESWNCTNMAETSLVLLGDI